MRNEFTAVVERAGRWPVAYCPEIPGANGQGRTKGVALNSLSKAIALILEDRRKDGLRGVPAVEPRRAYRRVKRGDLLRHLRQHGCHLKREGQSHSLWTNPATGAVEVIPRRTIPHSILLRADELIE